MHRDELKEYRVDFEGPRQTGGAMDTHAEQLDRPCSGRHCASEGSCAVRFDRAGSPRRLDDRAAVVALSPAEERRRVGAIGGEIIGAHPTGKSLAFQCRRSQRAWFELMPAFGGRVGSAHKKV